MTGYGTIESALDATRKGAFDYITKPFRKERILHVIEQALNWQRLQNENIYLRQKLEEKSSSPSLVGSTSAMRSLHDEIRKVAKTSATVLITGDSGTGKELVARALHSQSLRSGQQFIPIDCSTIPESIIESELFGHVKGSFTGAIRNKKGMVEEANHGTLFLDEIADLSPTMQVKLLRLLQEGEYKVVGSNAIRKVDIRFIAATNQNLSEKIRKGEFREDLYYRLNVINIQLPALSERRDDIPLLANHFLEKYNSLHGKNVKRISDELMRYLLGRDWPGNVRELEHVIERGVIMAAGDTLEIADALAFGPASKSSPQELSSILRSFFHGLQGSQRQADRSVSCRIHIQGIKPQRRQCFKGRPRVRPQAAVPAQADSRNQAGLKILQEGLSPLEQGIRKPGAYAFVY